MRRQFETQEITQQEYDRYLEQATAETIAKQEALGLDMLVHGEFERNDMVQYFGEQLSRLCLYASRLGPELRLTLCAPADYLWGCHSSDIHDSALEHLCPVADRQTRQRDAHGTCDDPQLVLRP